LTACAKKVPVPTNEIRGYGWFAIEEKPGEFLLFTMDQVQEQALASLCSAKYVCAHGDVGTIIEIRRIRK
jgi:hypothetical protein